MPSISYYSCSLTSAKKIALLAVCYSDKTEVNQSYEYILSIPHLEYSDYNAKKIKKESSDLESKAFKKAEKSILSQLPKIDTGLSFGKMSRKSFYEYIHKNHCSSFWSLWSSIRSKDLRKEVEKYCVHLPPS